MFLVLHEVNDASGIGVKIQSQVKAFRECGADVRLLHLVFGGAGEPVKLCADFKVVDSYFFRHSLLKKIEWRVSFKDVLKQVDSFEPDLLYVRYTHFCNPYFVRFLKEIRDSGVRVLMEVPTYPYDREYLGKSLVVRTLKKLEEATRNRMSPYIERVVTFSDDEYIWGVRSINIINAVDLGRVGFSGDKGRKADGAINVVAVASMEYWHGYDRLIRGLAEYNNNKSKFDQDVVIHLVGGNGKKTIEGYRVLVAELGVEDKVVFHGFKSGNDLDDLFLMADVGAGCLGVHRKGLESVSSIKNSEYCARGLPFFYSENDRAFDGQWFVLKVPADEGSVNFFDVIDLYERSKSRCDSIRQYAEENLSWSSQMRYVLEEAGF